MITLTSCPLNMLMSSPGCSEPFRQASLYIKQQTQRTDTYIGPGTGKAEGMSSLNKWGIFTNYSCELRNTSLY